MPKDIPSEVLVLMHEKGWMDEKGMKTWIDLIWKKWPGGLLKNKNLLIF